MRKIILATTLMLGLAACDNSDMTYNSNTPEEANRRMQHAEEYNQELSQSHGYHKTNVHQAESGFPVRRPYGCSPYAASRHWC